MNELLGGAGFGCARNETQVWCWGQYSIAHARLATVDAARTAAAVSLPEGIRMRSLHLGARHGCLLSEDGAAYCFGVGNFGAWGTGAFAAPNHSFPATEAQALTAHHVATLGHEVRELGAGADFSCALKTDGSVWCWGDNSHHIATDQEHHVVLLGSNKVPLEPLPVQRLDLGTDSRSLKVGQLFACVEKNDVALWCWGDNEALELPAPRSRFEPPHFIPLPAPRLRGRELTPKAQSFALCVRRSA